MTRRTLTSRLGRFLSSQEFRCHPLRAVHRRIRWRVHWKLRAQSPFVMGFYGGLKIRLAPSSGSSGIYLNGGFSDQSISQLLTEFLKPGMVVFDCGAHIGEYTLLFSSLVGPSGQVHSFEPDPRVFAYLRENTTANNLRNVVLNPIALSDDEGVSKFVLQLDATTSSLLAYTEAPGSVEINVPTTTLDKYVQSRGLSRVDALKIDCEGAERAILAGATLLLSELKPGLVFIECHRPEQVSQFVEEINEWGYDTQVNNSHQYPHLIAKGKGIQARCKLGSR